MVNKSEIIIKFTPFVIEQTIFYKHGEDNSIETISIQQKEIVNFIATHDDIGKIHLFGNKNFVQKIQRDYMLKYKNYKDEKEFFINN